MLGALGCDLVSSHSCAPEAFSRRTVSKDKPNCYVGCWVYKPSQQATKAQAKRWVAEIESRLARGRVGIEDHEDAPGFQALFDAFLDGLRTGMPRMIRAAGRSTSRRSSGG
jgi:hypothetical protein